MIAAVQERFAGYSFRLKGGIEAHNGRMRFQWEAAEPMVNEAYVGFLGNALHREFPELAPLQVLRPPRLNLLRLIFDPNGVRKVIINWQPVAKALLDQAHRVAAWARDDTMRDLITEILAYPGVPSRWREPDLEAPRALMLPFELDLGAGRVARMFSTVTTLSTPQDVTLQELHIEAFYPADAESEAALEMK
jgi:hypothetical protein